MRTLPFLFLTSVCLAAQGREAPEAHRAPKDLLASLEAERVVGSRDMIDTSGVLVESFRCPDSHERIACVTGMVDAPAAEVWQVITDYDQYGELIPRCTRSLVVRGEILPAVGESQCALSRLDVSDYALHDSTPARTALLYSEIDIIFPVGRVCSVLEVTSDSTEWAIYWRKLVSDIPTYEGAWLLVPQGDRTMVVCVTQYRLNAWMPPFLIHSGVHFYFPQIITALRTRVADSR